jgi:nicotine blue oxidoreductase
MSLVAGLVLAAGAGTRFGGPKAVAELDGLRLVDRAVRTLLDGGIDPAYVVAGAVPLEVHGAVVVPNPDWAQGIGSSLRAGLAALPDDVVAVVVVLVDQPGLTAAAVARVVSRITGPKTVASATYDGALGHPVALGRDHWTEVGRLAVGDTGARPFLTAHPELVARVECGDVASADDVDRPDDLRRFGRTTGTTR